MATASVETAGLAPAGAMLLGCVADEGSGAHPFPTSESLLGGPDSSRNLADLIHFLCILHGRYPGVVDQAAARAVEPAARAWLTEASYAFAGERAYLARLAVAAGPMPSTPGAPDSESTVTAQRHALEMLARSERNGCALGAALATALDWVPIRAALDAAAHRFGVEPPHYRAGDPGAAAALADARSAGLSVQRALLFGAQQLLLQHRGLWDLLESRAEARVGG